jgi:amino acid transporter
VGIIIGAGIFETPAKVMAAVSSPFSGLMLWIGGAVVAFCGALCYAELAATYPTDAGEAEYLTHAFGQFAGWYFTWIQLVCFRTAAAIVSIAYVFAKYAQEIWPQQTGVYVTAIIVVLTCVNALGLRPGKWTQNLLATAKVLGLGGLILAGMYSSSSERTNIPISGGEPRSLALAVVLIMYAYSGWHETAYIVGDLKQPGRNLPRAMLAGVGAVTVVYLAVNLSALHKLGYWGLREIGLRETDNRFGPVLFEEAGWPGIWFSILVVIVTLGSTNGTILSGSRLFSTVGAMQPGYGWLAKGRTKRDAPLAALAIQMLICLAFVAVIEFQGRGVDGFDVIVYVTSPVLWVVFLSAGLSLVVLRLREPNRMREYQVPLYPIVPFVYIAGCIYMLYESTAFALQQRGPELWLMGVLLAIGLPYWWFFGRNASSKRR